MAEEIIFPKNITIIIGCFNVIQSIEEIDLSQYDKLKNKARKKEEERHIREESERRKEKLKKKIIICIVIFWIIVLALMFIYESTK